MMREPTPVELVDAQLDAYNARDLKRFLEPYADDIEVFRAPAFQPVLFGKASFGRYYAENRFNLPDLRAEVVSRIVAGNTIVDHERIHGLADGVIEVAVVYRIVDGRIRTMHSFPSA